MKELKNKCKDLCECTSFTLLRLDHYQRHRAMYSHLKANVSPFVCTVHIRLCYHVTREQLVVSSDASSSVHSVQYTLKSNLCSAFLIR